MADYGAVTAEAGHWTPSIPIDPGSYALNPLTFAYGPVNVELGAAWAPVRNAAEGTWLTVWSTTAPTARAYVRTDANEWVPVL